jgi:Zn-dependent alcohol dehydrogenase
VIQAAKAAGATAIAGIDINPKKFELAKTLGMTHSFNPKDYPDKSVYPPCVGARARTDQVSYR